MSFAHKVAIAVDVSVEAPGEFDSLKEMNFLEKSEIHLIHIFQTTTYYGSLVYPVSAEREKLQQKIVALLKSIGEKNIPKNFTGKIHFDCLFNDTPKKAFCDYVEKNHINLVVVSSREKRGLFESSFAQYVSGHTKANMIILKHKSLD